MVPQLSPADPPVAEHKQVCVDRVEPFPHLTDTEFDEACSALLKRFELHGRRQSSWIAVERLSQNETTYLRINKPLASSKESSSAADDGAEIELMEEDDEVAETSNSSRAVIHYDVVLSPSYRIPVLYFSISDTLHRYPPTMETLYSMVIPPAFRAQAEHVGVIGGITITVGLRGKSETELTVR
jgi:ubiquitin-like-conjugating enzyme ATG10